MKSGTRCRSQRFTVTLRDTAALCLSRASKYRPPIAATTLKAHMDELPHPGIEALVGLHVAKGGDEGGTLPAVDLVGGGKPLPVDVDDLDVGGDDFIEAVIGRAVYLLGHGQAVAAGVRETDDLLEPGRAGGLEVKPRALFADDLSDALVEAELVASGVYRELEALRQAEGLGAPLGDADVRLELLEEGRDIADIVDALVEAARILGR